MCDNMYKIYIRLNIAMFLLAIDLLALVGRALVFELKGPKFHPSYGHSSSSITYVNLILNSKNRRKENEWLQQEGSRVRVESVSIKFIEIIIQSLPIGLYSFFFFVFIFCILNIHA